MEHKCAELAKELAVQDQMLDVLLKLQYVLNGDIASVLHIEQEALNADQNLDSTKSLILLRKKEIFVELAKELAVQGQMLDVLLKPQFALNGDTASVLHIDLEALNVDQELDLIKSLLRKKEIRTKESYVELAKELAVQDQMLDVLLKLQFALNGDTASVLHIDKEALNVDQELDSFQIQRKIELQMQVKCVELAKELAVQGLTLDVLLKPQFVQSSGIASVLFTDQVDHNAEKDLEH